MRVGEAIIEKVIDLVGQEDMNVQEEVHEDMGMGEREWYISGKRVLPLGQK